MRITSVETISVEAYSNIVWVRVVTDDGFVGLGETFRNPQAVISYIHETCAPYLLGLDPLQVEKHHEMLLSRAVNHFNGFPTRSVEIRGNSAIDIALWDIVGQVLNCPLFQLLGGRTNDRVRLYNTCAGASYSAHSATDVHPEATIWSANGRQERAYDDLTAQYRAPDDLARSLLSCGISAMKIWPFSPFALLRNGLDISGADLKAGVAIVEKIRKAVGDKMDILIELQGLWGLTPALTIAKALEDHDIYWFEDPVALHNFDDLERFTNSCRQRVAGSENLGSHAWYREAFTRGAIGVANFDVSWVGGITEARRVAALSYCFDRPISPHDCTGPVIFTVNSHLLTAYPNALIAEYVRAFYEGFYSTALTNLPEVKDGHIFPMAGPGLGTQLRPDFLARPDVTIRRTDLT